MMPDYKGPNENYALWIMAILLGAILWIIAYANSAIKDLGP